MSKLSRLSQPSHRAAFRRCPAGQSLGVSRGTTAGSARDRAILSPFNPLEAISTEEAAGRAGKSVGAIRHWCVKHGIGRKIVGEWYVSRVALEMLLADDRGALDLYHAGKKEDETVAVYFRMCGL